MSIKLIIDVPSVQITNRPIREVSFCSFYCRLVIPWLWTRQVVSRTHTTGPGDVKRPGDLVTGTGAEQVGVETRIEQQIYQANCTYWQTLCRYCTSPSNLSYLLSKALHSSPNRLFTKANFCLQDTSRNLTKVDQTLGQYRNYADTQAEAMAQVYIYYLYHINPSPWTKRTYPYCNHIADALIINVFFVLWFYCVFYCVNSVLHFFFIGFIIFHVCVYAFMYVPARGQPNGGNQQFSVTDAGQIHLRCPDRFTIVSA